MMSKDDEALAKKTRRKANQGNPVKPPAAKRIRPRGPERVICTVIEKATGRTVTEAAGRVTRKYSAEAMAKHNALRALKKKKKRHVPFSDYELAYRYG